MTNRRLMPLFWVMLIDTASYTIRFPVFALLFFDNNTRLFPVSASMATRSEWYGLCMALYWIGALIASPILSVASDYVGRRRILLFGSFGTFFFALGTALGALTGLIVLVLLGGLIGGLCSRMDPIAQAVVGDTCQEQHKLTAMSYLQFFISIGAFFGPIIGGYFAQRFWFPQLNFSLPFIIATVLAAMGVFIVLRYFRETAPKTIISHKEKFFSFKAVLANKKVLAISLLLILIQWSWSTYYQFISPILKKAFLFNGTEMGLFLGAVAAWLAVASAFGVPLLQRFLAIEKIIRYATYAIFIGILATLLITMFHPFAWFRYLTWIFAIPIAAGDVITYCAITTLYSDAVSPSSQGQVMGANFVIISAVWALTALFGGYLNGINPALPLCLSLVGVSLLLISFKKIWSMHT